MKRFTAVSALLATLALVGEAPLSTTQAQEVVVGTGSKSGVYYPVGRAICRLADRAGVGCEAIETAGSLFNLSNVHGGAIEFGIAQSDWQFHAVNGSGPLAFADGKFENLRAVFSLHGEPFTLVARRDAGIQRFDDLQGRRVNIGNPGSGQRATMEVVMAAKGWTKKDFLLAEELPAAQQSLALCHDRVQAMIYTVGHPNDSVGKAANVCDAVIVEVRDPEIDQLVADNPYYAYTTVPGGMYRGNPQPVTTFGVKATLVTSADVDADVVYALVRGVFENFEQFRKMHPALGDLQPERMVSEGLSAPLHDGAVRYFRERGWL